MKRPFAPSIPSIALLLAIGLFAVTGCGDDSPTAAQNNNGGGNQNNVVTADVTSIDFGVVCNGTTSRKTFQIEAPASNTGAATGEVYSTGTYFKIVQGDGAYSLQPGETRLVEVEFAPTYANLHGSGTVQIALENQVSLQGYGSELPFVKLTPVGLRSVLLATNTTLLNDPNSEVIVGVPLTGVTYSNPSWHSCSSAAWIIDGNPVGESWVEFEIDVPKGTTDVLMAIGFDAQSSCAQLLMEIDGSEVVKTGFGTACTTRSYRRSISSGKHTIRIGTDQQGVTCFADISLEHITFTFEGRCLAEDEFVR